MKVLVVYCHPHPKSFCHALLEQTLAGLAAHGHEVDLLDLYAEGFDPILGEAEWLGYIRDPAATVPESLREHIARVERCEGLVFVFPTWFFGLPAMLKGWFERVWRPGVSFDIPEDGGLAASRLRHLRLLGAVTTTGMPWSILQLLGYPGQRLIKRCVRVGMAPRCEHIWMALHSIEKSTLQRRERFLADVGRRFSRVR